MKPISVAAVVALLAAAVYAQEKLSESIEVRVINIDVMVTDRAGSPVHGLTKDDFEVVENGRKATITNLYEVTGAEPREASPAGTPVAAAAPNPDARPRSILVFIDNYSLEPARRADVLKSLESFIDRQKRPSDQMSIVAWNRSARVITPFTADNAPLKQGIATLRAQVKGDLSFEQEAERQRVDCQRHYDQAESGMIPVNEAYTICRGNINAFAEESYYISRTLLDGLRATLGTMAGVEGRKLILLAGAHLPEAPGEQLYFWLYRLFSRLNRNLSPMNVIDTPRTSQRINLGEIATQASADDVALYFIDGGNPGDFAQSAEAANSDTNALESYLNANNTADAFKRLADATGGAVVTRWQNFDQAFATISRDLNSYYSIGFKPQGTVQEGKNKRIAVTVRNSQYTVRARTLYTPKSLDTEVSQRVIANLFHEGSAGEMAITLKTGTPERDGKYFKIPMEITIPPTVTLLPTGNELAGGYTVYVAMGNRQGAMSKVMKNVQDVRIPVAAEKDLRSKPLVYSGTLMVRGGENTLSVAVVDRVTNATGYARAVVTVQ